jgi:hypothetical protein
MPNQVDHGTTEKSCRAGGGVSSHQRLGTGQVLRDWAGCRPRGSPARSGRRRARPQLVRADRAAGHDDGVVVTGGYLVEGLVDGELGLLGSGRGEQDRDLAAA